MKKALTKQKSDPDEEFVRWISFGMYGGNFTQNVKDTFSKLAQQALEEFIQDELLNAVNSISNMSKSDTASHSTKLADSDGKDKSVITTVEEIEAFGIIKSILHGIIDESRLNINDTKNYCSIVVDDNRTKSICRLYFNYARRNDLHLQNSDSKWVPNTLESLSDINNYAEQLRDRARLFV